MKWWCRVKSKIDDGALLVSWRHHSQEQFLLLSVLGTTFPAGWCYWLLRLISLSNTHGCWRFISSTLTFFFFFFSLFLFYLIKHFCTARINSGLFKHSTKLTLKESISPLNLLRFHTTHRLPQTRLLTEAESSSCCEWPRPAYYSTAAAGYCQSIQLADVVGINFVFHPLRRRRTC